MKTTVVNLREKKYEVFIGRGSVFGNPFTHKELSKTKALVKCKSVEEAVENYKLWILGLIKVDGVDPPTLEMIKELKGKVLGCYCDQKNPCHGKILATLADANEEQIKDFKLKNRISYKPLRKNIF